MTISDGVTRCPTCRHILKKGELTMTYNIRDIIICLIISVLTWILALFILNKLDEYEKRSTDKACQEYKICLKHADKGYCDINFGKCVDKKVIKISF